MRVRCELKTILWDNSIGIDVNMEELRVRCRLLDSIIMMNETHAIAQIVRRCNECMDI
ncbi:hypothetical protein SERLA73DRAFT_121941 [Serpula lacrymans var. lacrymans S7.3]|uniref:Uncharacterized protein n=1 Tax=Serpula lacrymans var. lacrymans (strain S7.3) TaxID=936435 RepID=F8PVL3_SERL3|nr:hypothetical protein SERLA73DRAFT_121941 [Serpula lacrymans var. lacrymans S7.3]